LFVAIGRGTQNYTCASPSATPVAVGAVATLFDFTSMAYTSEEKLHQTVRKLVYLSLATILKSLKSTPFQILGHHYFSANSIPTFNLSRENDILYAKKIASINAPTDADIGPDKTGAVPWLALDNNGGSIGLQEVYRVETAGGKAPPLCTSQGNLTIEYAAEYWFYGP
jgi:Protein of unknown function (DUF3455)